MIDPVQGEPPFSFGNEWPPTHSPKGLEEATSELPVIQKLPTWSSTTPREPLHKEFYNSVSRWNGRES